MTDRGKRIPLEKRINLRVIMGRAAFAVAVAAAVFWLSGRAPAMAAQEPEEGRYGPEIRITRNVEPAEDGEFQEPPDRYWDGWKGVQAGLLGDIDHSGTGCRPASGTEDGVYRCGRG